MPASLLARCWHASSLTCANASTTPSPTPVLKIGNQSRPRVSKRPAAVLPTLLLDADPPSSRAQIFDLNIQRAPNLYEAVVGVSERVTLVGYTTDPLASERAVKFSEDGVVESGYNGANKVVRGLSGEAVEILREPDLGALRPQLEQLYADGFRACAIVFIHSYTFPDHELRVGELAREIGFTQVSLSSQLLPMIKAVPRGVSATADAYLTPVLSRYLSGFFAGFEDDGSGESLKVEFMGSDGVFSSVARTGGGSALADSSRLLAHPLQAASSHSATSRASSRSCRALPAVSSATP